MVRLMAMRLISHACTSLSSHPTLRIKITENHVEIFLNLERLAIHPRSRHKEGRRVKIDEHFPELSKKRNRLSSGCGPMVVAEHSAEALSALNRVMG